MNKKHVVILGAGYAGLKTLRELQKGAKDVEITLVIVITITTKQRTCMKLLLEHNQLKKSHTILWMLSMKK